jgi:putative transcriptional regulator
MSKKAFDKIMAGAKDAMAYSQGDKSRGHTTHVKPIDVAAVRKKTGLSQAEFSQTYAIPLATLQHWEHGVRHPSGAAAVLPHVIDKQPATVTKVAREARMSVVAAAD